MYNLSGKTAFVTGGGGGIGREIALQLAEHGCDIGLFDLNADGVASVAGEIEAKGRKAAYAIGDVADRASVDKGVAALKDAVGTPDILINNAGILRVGLFLEQSYKDFNDQFRINVDGTFHVSQAVIPWMLEKGNGSVVNMASWLGKRGMAHYSGYCASKSAVIGMTQTMALEFAKSGIRVNCVCPGTITETTMRTEAEAIHKKIGFPSAEERVVNIPIGRLGKPDDVARVVCFLASDEADYMTGQSINITGGLWLN
ncbi:SDR family oxidoreductase [Acuticoccus sp. M5D2P5]|uniref:SDR family NAD(P)-dependent oxidoreductase n=1 Tax=Acuticoccus kalidii TaxID=2910977 RepID=UPI001F32F0A9|nr:SDR family NAD(P)-dependent oxidoreductase [Acuticoccus kalidii]MCF3935227.1 SDR family oxidoreductase [Acuticoccus kalidii]